MKTPSQNPSLFPFLFLLLVLFLFLVPLSPCSAQPGFDDDVQDTPIDGGTGLLLAAGAAYGWKRIKKREND